MSLPMEVLYLFEKARIKIDLIQTETLLKGKNYEFEPLSFEILKTAFDINETTSLNYTTDLLLLRRDILNDP